MSPAREQFSQTNATTTRSGCPPVGGRSYPTLDGAIAAPMLLIAGVPFRLPFADIRPTQNCCPAEGNLLVPAWPALLPLERLHGSHGEKFQRTVPGSTATCPLPRRRIIDLVTRKPHKSSEAIEHHPLASQDAFGAAEATASAKRPYSPRKGSFAPCHACWSTCQRERIFHKPLDFSRRSPHPLAHRLNSPGST